MPRSSMHLDAAVEWMDVRTITNGKSSCGDWPADCPKIYRTAQAVGPDQRVVHHSQHYY